MGIVLNTIKKKEVDDVKARETLNEALSGLTYDFGDGRIIQTRPADQQSLLGKIEVINAGGSNTFIMADNVVHPVSVTELEAALASGMLATSSLWDTYMAAIS